MFLGRKQTQQSWSSGPPTTMPLPDPAPDLCRACAPARPALRRQGSVPEGVSGRLCWALTCWLHVLVYSPILPKQGWRPRRRTASRVDGLVPGHAGPPWVQQRISGWEEPEKLGSVWGLWSAQGREEGSAHPKTNPGRINK